MAKLLVTGSSGLIGSEVCAYFSAEGWDIHGADNNMRAVFFGPQGDTRWNQRRLERGLARFTHHELDLRNREGVLRLIEGLRPDAIVHTAAQPSHDLAAKMPFEDFDTNAVGTMNLLEAVRRFAPEAPFAHMSTNKVYGDAPNELPLVELEKRWDFRDLRLTHLIPATRLQADYLRKLVEGCWYSRTLLDAIRGQAPSGHYCVLEWLKSLAALRKGVQSFRFRSAKRRGRVAAVRAISRGRHACP